MPRVGFIGLGTLGREIAKRLKGEGVELLVWNRTLSKAKELGFDYVKEPQELLKEVETLFIMVFDSYASEEVIFGKLNRGNLKGKVIIDMTTNHPSYTKRAFEELKKLGAHYLEAPVLGSVLPARKGQLTVLVSGEEKVFKEKEWLFKKFCKSIYYLGEVGRASELKLINNLVLGGFMAVLGEAIGIGLRAGFDKELLIKVLEDGAGKSLILEAKKDKIRREDFSTHFSVDLIYKDLHYLQDLLMALKGFSLTLPVVKEAYGILRSLGLGDKDFSVISKFLDYLKC